MVSLTTFFHYATRRGPLVMLCLPLALWLSACAGKQEAPEKALTLNVAVEAADRINPDGQGRSAPVQVRVFELRSRALFEEIDFFSLQSKPRQSLGNDLVQSDEMVLRPGDKQRLRRRAGDASVAIGVIAGFRDLGNATWRAVYVLPDRQEKGWWSGSTQPVNLLIKIGADTVSIVETD